MDTAQRGSGLDWLTVRLTNASPLDVATAQERDRIFSESALTILLLRTRVASMTLYRPMSIRSTMSKSLAVGLS